MFIHLEKLSLLYPISLFTLPMLMLLSMYKYHSLSFQVGLGLNYGLWEMSWMFEHFGAWWDRFVQNVVKGISFLWKKKNKCVAAHLWFMKDEVWLKSNDGSQTLPTQTDSLGPVSTSPKRHTYTQMLSRSRGHMWPPKRSQHSSKSAEEQRSYVSWLAAISLLHLSVHPRDCAY